MTFDIAVVGLGAMGSATAFAAASRGARVIAFDQLTPPHTLGSSHGHTRIIREAYYEHPLYVPLVQRAYELWRQLEQQSGDTLLLETGGLMAGPVNCELVRGAQASAEQHGIRHELLDAAAIARRFPAYRPRRDCVALFEHRAGMLRVERCLTAFQSGAVARGAQLQTGTPVIGWRTSANGVVIETSGGTYAARCVVVAAGAWLPALAQRAGIRVPLEVERQLSHWFTPAIRDPRFSATNCPVGLWDADGDADLFATLPDDGHGVKCGAHHAGAATMPETVDRTVSDAENDTARRMLEAVMPGAGGAMRESRVCLYTNTPDRHFIVDWATPGRVLVLSPCSGHGFKFASAIGEIAAQLALDGTTWMDLAPFSLSRFA